jgi:hypothetical protein
LAIKFGPNPHERQLEKTTREAGEEINLQVLSRPDSRLKAATKKEQAEKIAENVSNPGV